MHGVHKANSILDAAFADETFYGSGDVDEASASGDFKPEMFGEAFHEW